MKTIYSAIAAAAAILGILSCTKEDACRKEEPQDGPYEVSIIARMAGFDTGTKSYIESCIRMEWNTTDDDTKKDSVWVYGSNGSAIVKLGCLKATSSSDSPYTATLRGTISSIPGDNHLYMVHCPGGTYSEPSLSSGSMTFDMSAVEQSADVVPFVIYSAVNVSETSLSGLTADFHFATSVVKLNVTGLTASAALTKATVSNVNKNCTLTFSDGAVAVTAAPASPESSDLGTFTKNLSGNASADGDTTLYLGVPALSAKADRELTVTADGDDFIKSGVFPSAHPANKFVSAICCLEESEKPEYTVTYTPSSVNAVTASGTIPTGSSATYSQTYSIKCCATQYNSLTLTLSGYSGKTITAITLSMHSNQSKGAGTFSAVAGTTILANINTSTDFSKWYNNTSYGNNYRDIYVTMLNSTYKIGSDETVIINITASANSLYCQSYTITYK